MKNLKIKEALKVTGMKQWELAEILGVGESTLSRCFRRELSEEEQKRIVAVIQEHSIGGE